MSTKLISFIYTIIIARLLAPNEVGSFYLVLSVLWILYIFTDMGILNSLGRYVPYLYGKGEFGKLKSLVRLSYVWGGALTFIFSILVFLLSGFISSLIGQPSVAPLMQMMSIWLLIKEIDDINRGILGGRKRMKQSQGLDSVQNLAKLIITLIAFYIIGFNADALSIGFMASFILIVPIGAYYVIQEMKTWEDDGKKQTFAEQVALGAEVVSFGIVITLITSLWTVIQYTDKIILSSMTNDALAKIAVYTMAVGLANLVLIFPSGITSIFFPVVSELHGKKDIDGVNRTLNISMKWLVMLAVPLTIIMAVFGDQLLRLFYGGIYETGAVVLTLFVVGLFIQSIVALPQLILAAMRRLDVELKAVAVGAIANVILNFLFIPLWGINGSAFASMLSLGIMGIMIVYYSRKIYSFSFPKEIYKPLLAGIAVLVVIFLLKSIIVSLMYTYIPEIQIGASKGQLADEMAQKMVKLIVFGLLFLLSAGLYFLALLAMKSFGEEELVLLEAGMKRARIPTEHIARARAFFECRWSDVL
jgi:O-antigen/teichoic acid export membrane protein